MRVFSHKTRRTLNGETSLVRPLTFWQKLYTFVGVRDEGSQLVEMAVVAPILLVILTGMASFGMALYSQQQLGFAAASAVQAVATGATLNSGNPCQSIETTVSKALPSWSAAGISYSFTIYYTVTNSNGTTTLTPASQTWTGTGYSACSTSTLASELGSTASQFQPAVLTVSYPYSWFPIFTWAKYGSTFTPSGSLQTTQAAMIQ